MKRSLSFLLELSVQIRAALRFRVVRELFLVHRDEMTVLDGHASMDHGLVYRSAHGDRSDYGGGIVVGAD